MLREINLNELYQISLCIPPVYLECTLFFYLASLIYYWLPIKKKKKKHDERAMANWKAQQDGNPKLHSDY